MDGSCAAVNSLTGSRAFSATHARQLVLGILWLIPLAFLGLFYFYPLGSILALSFARSEGDIFSPFLQTIQSTTLQRITAFTIWQAGLSTLLTLALGLPGAYLLARFDFRGKSLLQALAGIPFVMPTLVVAAAFYALLGPRGWMNLILMRLFNLDFPPLQVINTLYAILIAHVFYNTTIVLRMVGDYWSHLDPRLTQAARALGSTPWQAFRQVTLPLLMPSIAAAALLVFIFDFTSFGVILVLGGPRFATLEVEIYYQTVSLFNLPLAAVLSLLQLVCTLALTVTYTHLANRLFRPLKLRPQRFTQKRLATWQSQLFAGLMILAILALLISPLIALAARSFVRLEPERGERGAFNPGITFDFYKELAVNRRSSLFYVPPTTAMLISLVYGALTVVISLAIGLPASWALARDTSPTLNRFLDPLLMLPLGTSAVTLGLGFIVALNRPPVDLRASPVLVPIAHSLVAFPFVVRSLTPALRSIQPRLRAAAATLGASPARIIRLIDLPLVGRALLVSATFAFTISLGEFGATALVSRPEYPTLPILIYRYISQPGALNYGQALAMSTILMVVAAGGMLAIEKFRIAEVGEF